MNTVAVNRTPCFTRNWAFFLDVDGTLLQLADSPDAVVPAAAMVTLLQSLLKVTDGAVALVSGRSLAQHGAERRDAGGRVQRHHHGEYEAAFASKKIQLSRFVSERDGLLLEDKGLSVALHYRQAPERRSEVEDFVRLMADRLGFAFHLQKGKMVFEIKSSGIDKGVSISEFMEEPPFREKIPVFIGNDVTDEDGFRVVNRSGGCSIKVGAGETSAP